MGKPARVQLSRSKGWKMPPNTVVVARPSKWGNPHDWRDWRENWPYRDSAGFSLLFVGEVGRDDWCRDRAVQAFREDLEEGAIRLPVTALRGKNLACWCKPGAPCHADVLLELANAPTEGVGETPHPEGGQT